MWAYVDEVTRKRIGGLSEIVIRSLVSGCQLNGEDFVWKEGMSEWYSHIQLIASSLTFVINNAYIHNVYICTQDVCM